jgi:hypothetical protein
MINNTNLFILAIASLIVIHWATIQFYHSYCAPPNIYGFLKSIINSASPLCISANYIQFYSIKYYYSLWVSFTLLSCKSISEIILKTKNRIERKNKY